MRLRGQPNLGHEHDRALSASERRLDRGQVDLGLARAGDPVEQEGPPAAGLTQGQRDRLDGGALIAREGDRAAHRAHRGDLGPARALDLPRRDEAAVLEPPDRRAVGGTDLRGGQLGAQRQRLPCRPGEQLEDGALLRAQPLRPGERLGGGGSRADAGARCAGEPACATAPSRAGGRAGGRATGSSSTPERSRARARRARAGRRRRAPRSAPRAAPAAARWSRRGRRPRPGSAGGPNGTSSRLPTPTSSSRSGIR